MNSTRECKRKEPIIRIDCVTGGYLVNRYLALCYETIFNTKGTLEQNLPVFTRRYYKIQWANIKADIKNCFLSPNVLAQTDPNYWIRGAIGFDAATQSSTTGEPSSISWSHTVGSNSNRLLMVHGHAQFEGTVTADYDGNGLTVLLEPDNEKHVWYEKAPGSGAANVTITDSATAVMAGGAISFDGVDQTDTFGATVEEENSASPNDMALTTESNNSFRVDMHAGRRDDSTTIAATLDSGDVRHNFVSGNNQFKVGVFGYTNFQATAGANTHQWTTDAANNRYYAAYEVKEEAAAAVTDPESFITLSGVGN